ncbi:unnamed protein product [Vitrella brassicaformis CCMP3155]|uniref:Uncharacterized protein n=1 Tax=Vitrella brassicaformis (strain CCMP3155) TaxID=1169540 RepID=A0A0G4F042_VITBC|nr:unnamed protein product [Vitrella brassicaformis CCMP3155]|eukprot:CEM04460.1 unnamed protein product [Vitrella brassicaformis CCMP3155]
MPSSSRRPAASTSADTQTSPGSPFTQVLASAIPAVSVRSRCTSPTGGAAPTTPSASTPSAPTQRKLDDAITKAVKECNGLAQLVE